MSLTATDVIHKMQNGERARMESHSVIAEQEMPNETREHDMDGLVVTVSKPAAETSNTRTQNLCMN